MELPPSLPSGSGTGRGLPPGQGVGVAGEAGRRPSGGDHGHGPGQPGAGRDHAAQDGPGEAAGHLAVPQEELL